PVIGELAHDGTRSIEEKNVGVAAILLRDQQPRAVGGPGAVLDDTAAGHESAHALRAHVELEQSRIVLLPRREEQGPGVRPPPRRDHERLLAGEPHGIVPVERPEIELLQKTASSAGAREYDRRVE